MTNYSINLSDEYKNFSIKFLKKDEFKKQLIYDVILKIIKKHKCPYCNNEHITVNKYYYVYLKNGINEDGYLEIFRVKIIDFKCISKDCGKTFKLNLPFRYKNYRITINVVKKILYLFKTSQIFSKIVCNVGVNVKIVKKICEEEMDEINRIEDEKNLKNMVKHLCIDEKFISKKKGFYTIFYDFDKKKEIFSCKGRNTEAIKIFVEKFGKNFVKNIEIVSLDMSKIYISGVSKYISKNKIAIDKFHFIKNFNETLLKKIYKKLLKQNKINIKKIEISIKNKENKEFSDSLHKTYNDFIDIRKLLIKNSSNLKKNKKNINNKEDIEKLKKEFIEIKEILEIRNKIDDFKIIKDQNLINKSFNDLFEKYSKSDVLEISKYCLKIKEKYLEYLKNLYIFNISNGPIEAFNRTIKQINNNGRGYKNVEMLLKIAKYVSNLNSLKCS